MKNHEGMNEARELREEIRNLYKSLPQLKTEIRHYEEERQAILEKLPVNSWQDLKVTSEVGDPTYQKVIELQKLEERYLKTLILVRRLESVSKILTDEEKVLSRMYFLEGKSLTVIGQKLGCKQETISRQTNRIVEKIENWLSF